jgi:hypothetical protein
MNCEKCHNSLKEDDFWVTRYLKCDCSRTERGFVGKYKCSKCNHYSKSEHTVNIGKKCIYCDHLLDVKSKNKKPFPTRLEGWFEEHCIEFHVQNNTYCVGHYCYTACDDFKCNDCKIEDFCDMGIFHCCCKRASVLI